MRKLSYVIIVALLGLLGFVLACSEENEDAKLSISIHKLLIPGEGNRVQVDVKSGCTWEVKSSEDWCIVSPNFGKGSGTLTVEVKRNPSTEKGRNANVILVSKNKDRETVALNIQQEKIATYEMKLFSQSTSMGIVEGSGTYETGEEVTIKAIAMPNHAFVEWSDGNKNSVRKIVMKQDMELEARFTSMKYKLSLSVSPASSGTVAGAGTYEYQTNVQIKATPTKGYTFSNWSDGNTNTIRIVTLDENKSLTAYFTANKHVLSLDASPIAGGTVTGGGSYDYNSSVTIKATPATGYTFSKWSDGSTIASRTITLKDNQTLTATFTPIKYSISLSAGTGGSVTGGGTYDYNSSVTIKATPSTGYMFSEWSDGNTSASRTITVKENQSLTARFVKAVYKITLTASPTAGGTVTGGGSYDYNSSVTIKATPSTGYTFSKWSDGSAIASRTITVKDNQTLTATFTPIKYRISLSAGTGGSVTGGGTYDNNSIVTIKATPATGYVFSEWSDGNTSTSRTITVKEDLNLTARFVKMVYDLTLTASPIDGGTVSGGGAYDYGTSVTLKAIPNEEYTFSKWSDGGTTNPRTLTMTASKILTAYFTKNGSNPSGVAVNGKLPGRFSVSATKHVSFAMGNLQYQASTKTWRFAENQYDVIGANNFNISSTYSDWIDLFGWGTSGYDSKYPYMTSSARSDYGNGSNDIAGTNYDWGVYNAISNGGNKAGVWRTLTEAEWEYLIHTRANAYKLRGQATVDGQKGYVLLPDGWSTPSGLTFTANPDNFTTNSYSTSEWSKMEAAGAVFLPCAGVRYGFSNRIEVHMSSDGYYWSSTCAGGLVGTLEFMSSGVGVGGRERFNGYSVRLATE